MSDPTASFSRVEELFHGAAELPTRARERWLRDRCGGDQVLFAELLALLATDADPARMRGASAPQMLGLAFFSPTHLVGRRLGRYRLIRCIATGGMGSVYEATQAEPRRRVAVKVLRADIAAADTESRFRGEAAALARLQHPGIAQIFEAGVQSVDGHRLPFMSLEFIEGARSITDYCNQRGLDVRERLELFAPVCDAVHHGHLHGIIHRDLKPGNILVDAQGRPKLIDFGVARAISDLAADGATKAGMVLGTLAYMSPEQCSDPRDVDLRTDVYALGLVLFELVCGRLPYDLEGTTLPELLAAPRGRMQRATELVPGLARDLDTILATALERDRRSRYQSVPALRDDLERFLSRKPILARPASRWKRGHLWVRRNPVVSAALAAVALVTVLAGVLVVRFALGAHAARQVESHRTALAHVAAADLAIRAHDCAGAEGHLLAVPPELRGWEWEYLAQSIDLSERVLRGSTARCDSVAWSGDVVVGLWPDTERPERTVAHAFSAADGTALATLELATSRATRLCATPDGTFYLGGKDGVRSWQPTTGALALVVEGMPEVVAMRGGDAGVLVAFADGSIRAWRGPGSAAVSLSVPVAGVRCLAWAPGGGGAAVGGADGAIVVVALDGSGDVLHLRGHERPVEDVAFDPTGRRLASGSVDGSIALWDMPDGRELRRLNGHESEVRGVAFGAAGELFSASADGTVRVWDASTGVVRRVMHGHGKWITSLAVAADGRRCATSALDGTIRIWDPAAPEPGRVLASFAALARDVAISTDGRWVGAAVFDRRGRVLELGTGALIAALEGHRDRVISIDFDPGADRVVTGADDGHVRVFDRGSGALLRDLADHGAAVHAVAFSPDGGRWIASGSTAGKVLLHRGSDFALARTLDHDAAWVDGLAFDGGGERLATASRAGVVRLWRVADGALLWSRRAARATRVAVSARAGLVASAHVDGKVILHELETGAERAVLAGHSGWVHCLAFSPDGTRLATAGDDRGIRLWDVAAALETVVLRGHPTWVFGLAFTPDGRVLVSCGGNYNGIGSDVRVWPLAAK